MVFSSVLPYRSPPGCQGPLCASCWFLCLHSNHLCRSQSSHWHCPWALEDKKLTDLPTAHTRTHYVKSNSWFEKVHHTKYGHLSPTSQLQLYWRSLQSQYHTLFPKPDSLRKNCWKTLLTEKIGRNLNLQYKSLSECSRTLTVLSHAQYVCFLNVFWGFIGFCLSIVNWI